MSNLVQSGGGLPSTQEFATMKELGKMAVSSGLLPNGINTPEKAVIIMLKGRELGIPPMQAFSSIAVINGKPTMSAELMMAMIYRNVVGSTVNYLETTSEKCVIEAKRPGGKATKFSFTMEDAKRANLVGKGPWQTYPGAMLRARCISSMARAMFPDALSGVVYTPEELGADVNDEGDIVSVPIEVESQPVETAKPSPIVPAGGTEFPGDYVMAFGPFGKKALKDIKPAELANYMAQVEAEAKAKNKQITGVVAKFMQTAGEWLAICAEEGVS